MKQNKEASYSYKLNAGLVLQGANRDGQDKMSRKQLESLPSGEAESLVNKPRAQFGDRVQYSKPFEESSTKVAQIEGDGASMTAKRQKNFQLAQDLQYRPKTRETQSIYNLMIHFVQKHIGDPTTETLLDCTDEVIVSLKTHPKRSNIQAILGELTSEEFNQLIVWCQKLTDYEENAAPVQTRKEQEEIAIELDEEEEEPAGENLQQVVVDDDQAEQVFALREPQQFPIEEAEEERGQIQKSTNLKVEEVGADWLQSQLKKKGFPDSKIDQIQIEILQVLSDFEQAARDCEKKLIRLLTPKQLDLIKLLVKNRHLIYFSTKLNSVTTDAQRTMVEEQMKTIPEGRLLLLDFKLGKTAQISTTDDFLREIDQKVTELNKKQESVLVTEKQVQGNLEEIDLNELKFAQGPRLMTNQKCTLPKGSTRLTKQGYEEVYVPAKRQRVQEDLKLIPVSSLPSWMQPAFPSSMTHLNRIQSVLCNQALNSPENILVCAPTGAGKTNIALLACLQVLSEMRSEVNGKQSFNLKQFKIIYIAPMKALVSEMVDNFQARLKPFGITVRELTGDVHLSKQQIEQTNIIVTTPEKWDIITRKSGERAFVDLVKLVIIDEVHLLHDTRGPVLEAIVARTMRQIEETSELIRIVGLSATLPNYQDVAALLRVDPETGLYFFDSTYRPVPLEQVFVGISEKKAMKKVMLMNEICYQKVLERVEKHQIIIFCHSRKETARTAKIIRDMAQAESKLDMFVNPESQSKKMLVEIAVDKKQVFSQDLQDILPFGIGIHHAGLSKEDRAQIEDLFSEGHIKVLVSTATLAWGVNLPAHTVIIKGTQIYSPEQGRWVELSPQDVLQMMGRAGRPQFDTLGEGIIITSFSELQYYLSLNNQQLPIESQLLSSLADHLNAEIVLGTVSNLKEAVNWMSYTYLFIRMRRNPELYGVDPLQFKHDPTLIKMRLNMLHSAALQLQKAGMVKYDRKYGLLLPTALGKVASHYYIKCDSMFTYNDLLRPYMSTIDIFRLFSLSKEFENIPIRDNERVELQKFIDRVPVPVKGSMEESATKINVLLQASIARFKLDGYDLNADMVYVTQSGSRIMRALFEIALVKGWASLADNLLNACKMVEQQQWYSMTPLRQFANSPALSNENVLVKDLLEISRRIERKEQFKWADFYEFSAQKLGELLKYPKMGQVVLNYVHKFPRLEISAYVQPVTRSTVKIELELKPHPDFKWDQKFHGYAESFWIFVHDCDNEQILHSEQFVLHEHTVDQEHTVWFHVPLFDPLPPLYFVKIVSDKWLQAEHIIPVSFNGLVLPEKYPAPAQLQPLNAAQVEDLNFAEGEQVYKSDGMHEFSPIVTNVFESLYFGSSSIFIGTPSGRGDRRILAELAVFNEIQKQNFGKIVYISPNADICLQTLQSWKRRLGEIGLQIEMLQDDPNSQVQDDLAVFAKADIIISTAKKWDILTRKWRTRKQLLQVSLYIFDDLHVLGEYPAYEASVSRIRSYLQELQANKEELDDDQIRTDVRFVGLAHPIANCNDICDWLGVQHENSFNFDPKVRNQANLTVIGFDHYTRIHRQLQMMKPTYNLLKRNLSQRGRGIVFTADASDAKKLAQYLVKLMVSYGEEDMFQGNEQTQNQTENAFLDKGIAYVCTGTSNQHMMKVKTLFKQGKVRVLVVPNKMCWAMSDLYAEIVIVQDTQRYNAQTFKHQDIPLADMCQMFSTSCCPKGQSKCFILCHSSKKNFISKFIQEPLPLESGLPAAILDHMLAEIANGVVTNIQEAIDWVTWSFLYRRIVKNPNFYDIAGRSPQHINDYLSQLVEDTVAEMEEAGCISVNEEDMQIEPTSFAQIAVHYNLKFQTVKGFVLVLSEKAQLMLRDVFQILCQAVEFEDILSTCDLSDEVYRQLAFNLPFDIDPDSNFAETSIKASILLQCHFSRKALPLELQKYKSNLVSYSVQLTHAMVDILCSSHSENGKLRSIILCMELCQMLVQACWTNVSPLVQLPYLNTAIIDKLAQAGVHDIADFMNMEDQAREKLVQLQTNQMEEVAEVCNRYPNLELVINPKLNVNQSSEHTDIQVTLMRDFSEQDFETKQEFLDELLVFRRPVPSLDFPFKLKLETWWLVVGQPETHQVVAIKKVTNMHLHAKLAVTLKVQTSELASLKHDKQLKLKVYLICDSFMGADLEKSINFQFQ